MYSETEDLDEPIVVCDYDGDFIEFAEECDPPLSFTVVDDKVIMTQNTTKRKKANFLGAFHRIISRDNNEGLGL